MNTDKSNVIAQGYVDPNRKEQGGDITRTVTLTTVPATINCKIPTFSEGSIDNQIQLSNKINPIGFLAKMKELEMQEQNEVVALEETFGKAEKNISVRLDPTDPEPERTVEILQELVVEQKIPNAQISGAAIGENTKHHARGETPVIAHIDELPYYKEAKGEVVVPSNERDYFNAWTKGEDLGPVGPVGELGLKGPDDSGLAADYDGNAQRRKPKRSGSKKKSKHLPNMKSRVVKAALGSAILGKLGKIQRDTTDAVKRDILKDVPLSGFVEAVTGKTLPDYQKRLLDLQQARSEGTLKPEIAEVLGDKPAKLEVAE